MRRSLSLLTATCGASVALALIAGGAAMPASALAGHGQVTSAALAGDVLPGLPIPVDAGNGLIADVTPSNGNVLVRSSVGIAWDSSIRGVDRYDLGAGVTWDAPFVTTGGGVWAYLPGHGVFAANADAPSGLDGYTGNDRFESFIQAPGVLPARDEVPEQHYSFTLRHASTGAVDYFNVDGHVIATIAADGSRTDRLYDRGISNRLSGLIDEGGAATEVEYLPGEVQLHSASGPSIRLVRFAGQIAEIVTPEGGRSTLHRAGLGVSGITSEASSVTTDVRFVWNGAKPERVAKVTRNGEVVYEAR